MKMLLGLPSWQGQHALLANSLVDLNHHHLQYHTSLVVLVFHYHVTSHSQCNSSSLSVRLCPPLFVCPCLLSVYEHSCTSICPLCPPLSLCLPLFISLSSYLSMFVALSRFAAVSPSFCQPTSMSVSVHVHWSAQFRASVGLHLCPSLSTTLCVSLRWPLPASVRPSVSQHIPCIHVLLHPASVHRKPEKNTPSRSGCRTIQEVVIHRVQSSINLSNACNPLSEEPQVRDRTDGVRV